jgi:uncharacterized protein (TIGR02186 family)
MTNTFVIPAKAGIQRKHILMHKVHTLLRGSNNNVFADAHPIFFCWIPAFAGMTMLLLLTLIPTLALAKPLVSDLDTREIHIDSGFTGKDLLLFGARNDAGDIVLVVRGPEQSFYVRKKERIAGIWVNRNQLEFTNVPGFYAIATSASLEKVHNDPLLKSLDIGLENVKLHALEDPLETIEQDYQAALKARKQFKKLYPESNTYAEINFIGDTLFRSIIHFPDNIPRGVYTAEVYLFSGGQLSGVQSTPIIVRKTGFDAFVYDLAYEYPLLYGLIAITIALSAGWIASFFFRRR